MKPAICRISVQIQNGSLKLEGKGKSGVVKVSATEEAFQTRMPNRHTKQIYFFPLAGAFVKLLAGTFARLFYNMSEHFKDFMFHFKMRNG